MPRAFITGISGQDGSYLSELLVAEGYDVHALTFSSEPRPSCPGVQLHRGDLTDIDRVRSLLVEIAPDEIYNLAAISSVARSWQEPDLTARVNGLAAVGLLESALQTQEATGNLVRFVQASSAEIFGEPAESPQDESTPLRPVNPYGAAKAYAHLMTGVYRGRGLHAVSAILYNHESPRRPPQFVTRKITSGAAAIARGETDSISLGNLDARRDWGWAPDYVEAMVRAARADDADDYVIATGESRSVRDFVTAAFRRAGIDDWESHVQVDPGLVRPADPSDLTGDARRARNVLGWQPSVHFDEIVGQMVEADLGSG